MKSTCATLAVLVLLAIALADAERRYPGASGPSVEETNYGIFRHMGPDTRIVNLPGGEHAREDYQMEKMHQRILNKAGVNQLRRRRSAPVYHLPVDADDVNY